MTPEHYSDQEAIAAAFAAWEVTPPYGPWRDPGNVEHWAGIALIPEAPDYWPCRFCGKPSGNQWHSERAHEPLIFRVQYAPPGGQGPNESDRIVLGSEGYYTLRRDR